MNGYPIDPSHLDLDVYRLLLPFAASQALHDLADGDESDPLYRMREQFERSEACRLLLTIAVTVRNGIEKRGDHLVSHNLDVPVGTLVEDVIHSTTTPLTFREACHKIIHARDIDFLCPGPETEGLPPLSTQVKLSGAKPVKGQTFEWEAMLDVAAFARQAYKLT